MREVKFKEQALVAVGTFNPAIFQPWWFAANKLIGEGEAAAAQIKLVHPTTTQFSLGLVEVQVSASRFTVSTSDEGRWESVRDLVSSTFKKLRHDPVTALGINVLAHFSVADEADWHRIGHDLVPKKKIWEKILKNPGTRSVIVEGSRSEDGSRLTNVRIEPSGLYKPGIFVDINDHYLIADKVENSKDGLALSELLEKAWKPSIENSNRILDTLMKEL